MTPAIKTGMTVAELYTALGDGDHRRIPENLYIEVEGVCVVSIDAPRPEDGQYWCWAYWMLQSGLTEPTTPIVVDPKKRRPIAV